MIKFAWGNTATKKFINVVIKSPKENNGKAVQFDWEWIMKHKFWQGTFERRKSKIQKPKQIYGFVPSSKLARANRNKWEKQKVHYNVHIESLRPRLQKWGSIQPENSIDLKISKIKERD